MKNLLFILLLLISGLVSSQSVITWSQTASISTNQFGNMHPRVVIDGAGNPMVIWGNGNDQEVYFSRWAGNGFANPLKINPDTIPVFAASWGGPDLASHGDTVYVVFKETPEDVNGIYIVHSFDGGVSFSAPVRVDAIADSISRFPALATDAAGNPLAAFMKFDHGWGNPRYVLARSVDFGNTFNKDVPASGFSGGVVCDCCPATVTTSGDVAAVLYRDNLSDLRNTWAGVSFDGGATFSNGLKIDDTDWMVNACPASGPDGVIIGDSLYSVFMSAANNKTLCYFSHSSLNDLQMGAAEPLTGEFAGLTQQNYPRMAAAGNAAVVVWKQIVNGNSQLAVKFTDDISAGFSAGYAALVANNVVDADVAMINGKIYVVWEAQNDGTVKYKTGTYTATSGLSLDVMPARALEILPNPVAENELYVHIENATDQPVYYSIYSVTGSLLLEGEDAPEQDRVRIDTSGLPKGCYWLRMCSGDYKGRAGFVRE